MATLKEKIASSLEALKQVQKETGQVALRSDELSRTDRERLEKNGFLKKVTRGWYIPVPPDEREGDSSSWYANYWSFCARYLKERFGDSYWLSAEHSLAIHAGNWSVPSQLVVRTESDSNQRTDFPHGTSLFCMKSSPPEEKELTTEFGLRILNLPSSLVHCSPSTFKKEATDIYTALGLIRDPSEILELLLDGGNTRIAGRIAGAFRKIGKASFADTILETMQRAGHDVRETDPFEATPPTNIPFHSRSPFVTRIHLMWERMREPVLENFPSPPGSPKEKEEVLQRIEELYVEDAYHSLSIERYQVSAELIERVKEGEWNPESEHKDQDRRNALAAKGYYDASQKVRESISRILDGANSGSIVEADHGTWYRELFGPSVSAGILAPSDLAGYRNDQVYIAGSKHVPMSQDAVKDVMPEFFDLLKKEEEASVRAVLGHFIFVFIHPYMDGNGRMARFLMNAMLISGTYPWTVIPVEKRDRYMQSLEKASIEGDITPLTLFIADLVEQQLSHGP